MSIRGRVVHTFIRMRVRVLSAHNAATGRYPEPLRPSPIRWRNPPQHVHSACATHTLVSLVELVQKRAATSQKTLALRRPVSCCPTAQHARRRRRFSAPKATWQNIGPGWPMCYTEGPGQHKPGNSGGAPKPAMFPRCATTPPAAHL